MENNFQKKDIVDALMATKNNFEAARLLGISISTIQRYINKFDCSDYVKHSPYKHDLCEKDILYAIDNTDSIASAARFINIPVTTFRRYVKQFGLTHVCKKYGSAWNKGLTVETDTRVAQNAASLCKTLAVKKEMFGKSSDGRASTVFAEELRRRKISSTLKRNPKAGGLRHGSGRGHKGYYKGFFCDSTYELAFVAYCLDKGLDIRRNHTYYEYLLNDEKHKYYPDFEINGCLYEIKGYKTDAVELKTQAVKDKPLFVLYYDDIKPMIEYVLATTNVNVLEDLYENV